MKHINVKLSEKKYGREKEKRKVKKLYPEDKDENKTIGEEPDIG